MSNLNIDKDFNQCFLNYSNDFVDCQKVIDVWEPDFPNLNIVLNKRKIKLDRGGKSNITFHHGIDRKEFEKLFNKCGINLFLEDRCEYPHEIERAALSRSIVVTLDKGPCSEIFKDTEGDVFSVYCKKKKLDGGLGSKYIFDGVSLAEQMRKIMSVDSFTMKNICRRNYGEIRSKIKKFEESLKNICRNLVLIDKENKKTSTGSYELEVQPVHEDENLPNISLVTLTHNRKEMFRLATLNYNMTTYPSEKIEWIIVDDSEDGETVESHLPANQIDRENMRIKYIKLESKTEIGLKRNIGVENASNDVILFMDDDD